VPVCAGVSFLPLAERLYHVGGGVAYCGVVQLGVLLPDAVWRHQRLQMPLQSILEPPAAAREQRMWALRQVACLLLGCVEAKGSS
jgi:hypothetical protein